TAQLNLQFAGAVGKRYHLGSHSATIEVGGKFRNAHKFDNQYLVDWAPNGSVPMTDFPSRFSNNDYYDGTYKLGPNVAFPDVFAFVQATQGQFTETSRQGADPAAFSLIEKVSAGYVMNTIDFNKIRLVAGVRFEGTNLDTKTPLLDPNSGAVVGSFNAGGSYVKVLPSASIRYALTNDTALRLVYSRGMSRPDPQDIAQAIQVTP